MKKIHLTIDEQLFDRVDQITRKRKVTRSEFIRDALESEIRRQETGDEEMRHAEGYARNPVKLGEFDVWVTEQDWGA